MDELVLQIVELLLDERKKAGKAPELITMNHLNESVRESLNRLYKDGKIKAGDTINDKYIRLE